MLDRCVFRIIECGGAPVLVAERAVLDGEDLLLLAKLVAGVEGEGDNELEDEGNYIYYYDDDVRKDFAFFNEQTSQPNITMIPGFCRVRPIWRGGDWSWPLRGQVQ